MNWHWKTIFMLIVSLSLLAGCGATGYVKHAQPQSNKLIVQADGSLQFRDRPMQKKDVIIYADGRGGERAAVKVRVPFHPDFYRDSIVVEREQE